MKPEFHGEKKMIDCEWCGGNELPFHKLREKGFICEDCYKGLERDQKIFELQFKDRKT